jgi:hypothetical protein
MKIELLQQAFPIMEQLGWMVDVLKDRNDDGLSKDKIRILDDS